MPLVTQEALQIEKLTNPKTKQVFGVRVWPRGGRRRHGGNVAIYTDQGNVDINGHAEARDALRPFLRGWTSAFE